MGSRGCSGSYSSAHLGPIEGREVEGWREVDGPPGLHLIVEEGSINSLSRLSSACFFLFVHSGRGRQPTYMKRKRGGYLVCRSKKATNKWKQPMLWSFDSLMPVCACCHAGKSGGFGRFYLLLDLNQWLSPYESDTLTAESSRSSWVKSEKIEKKRKPTKAQPEFSAGWSAKKEKALSLYEMKQRLAH